MPTDDWAACTEKMVQAGLWLPGGVPGVYGRNDVFEAIATAFEALITRQSLADGAERVFFPPVMNRATVTKTGYMQSFPHLCGSVHSFTGSEQEHADLMAAVDGFEDWSGHLTQTELTLVPAACYPLYPTLSGALRKGGRLFDMTSYVFRHEPSADPARLQIFRQKENVRLGSPGEVEEWRGMWMDRGVSLLEGLGLEVKLEVANDPFFGRGGKMLARNQTAAHLKFEITAPLFSDHPATALASFNYHEDKFGTAFDIRQPSGEAAHTACLGFGLERVTLALFLTHGLVPERWPESVRSGLNL